MFVICLGEYTCLRASVQKDLCFLVTLTNTDHKKSEKPFILPINLPQHEQFTLHNIPSNFKPFLFSLCISSNLTKSNT